MPPSMSGKSGTNHHSSTSAPEPPPGVELPENYTPRRCRRCGYLVWSNNLHLTKCGTEMKSQGQSQSVIVHSFRNQDFDFDSLMKLWLTLILILIDVFFLIAEHHPPAIHKDLEYFQVTIRSISRTREKLVAGSCMGGRKSPATCRKPLLIVPQGAVQQSVMWHCHNNNHALQSHFIFWFFNFYKFSLFKCKLSTIALTTPSLIVITPYLYLYLYTVTLLLLFFILSSLCFIWGISVYHCHYHYFLVLFC